MKRILMLLAVALVTPAVAHATTATATAQAELQAGVAAYHRGDYQQALADFRQLAAQGYAGAENNLGVMYNDGQGVLQDYAKALKWLALFALSMDLLMQRGPRRAAMRCERRFACSGPGRGTTPGNWADRTWRHHGSVVASP